MKFVAGIIFVRNAAAVGIVKIAAVPAAVLTWPFIRLIVIPETLPINAPYAAMPRV